MSAQLGGFIRRGFGQWNPRKTSCRGQEPGETLENSVDEATNRLPRVNMNKGATRREELTDEDDLVCCHSCAFPRHP